MSRVYGLRKCPTLPRRPRHDTLGQPEYQNDWRIPQPSGCGDSIEPLHRVIKTLNIQEPAPC
eukprot:1909275-Pyramimonas_sp.AAC.1